jgi:hypothetical protein
MIAEYVTATAMVANPNQPRWRRGQPSYESPGWTKDS